MEIIKENIDELNAVLRVKVDKSDYQPGVDKALAEYRKTANLKGFRKGMVPMGFIKKQYGRAVLGEELNKVVGEALNNYIGEQDFEILGNPLPKEEEGLKGDFDNPDTFEFLYEIGISPKIEVKLSGRNKFNYTRVKVDDGLIDKQIDDLTRRYGKLVAGEKVGERDLVMVQLVELNEKDEILEGGILVDSTISMEFITDEDTKKAFLDKKVDDKIVADPVKISRGGKDTAAMLNIEEKDLETVSDKFQVTIKEIRVMEPAELNQELFDKLFGDDVVKSEGEMRERIKNDLINMFEKDSERIFIRRITNSLIDKTEIPLPDDFLKRWILASQNNHHHDHDHDHHDHDHHHHHVTMEEVEEEYGNYVTSLKWQLIQNNIFTTAEIKIEQDEVIDFAKGMIAQQYAQYGIPLPDDAELTKTASSVLSDREQVQQIYDQLGEQKLLYYFKETVKINEEEVDYDKFLEIAKDING